jgi:hypothetical protein
MTKRIVLWGLASVLTAAFGTWRYFAPARPIAHLALIADCSRSMAPDCDAVVYLAKRAIGLPDVRSGSTLTLFATGSESSHCEPLLVAAYQLPIARRATESNRRLIERQKVFFSDLQRRCASLPTVGVSPIFVAITQVLAHLQTLARDGNPRLYLLARTDLRETVEPAIRKAIMRPGAFRAPLIDNQGATFIFCGFAESVGTGKYKVDRIKEVWRQVFSRPELVRFEPYCSKSPILSERQ